MSSASRTNGRPALPVSRIPALDLDMPASGSAWLVCPDCDHWVEAVRGLVQTHKPDGRRCTGSAQVLAFDLTPAQHAARRHAARIHLATPEAPAATIRSHRASFPESARRTARRETVHAEQHRAEAAMRPSHRTRTSMAAAFETAWERITQTPAASVPSTLGAA